jgi:hypothetical protein
VLVRLTVRIILQLNMDSAFIMASVALCYSIWIVTQQAIEVPLWFKITIIFLFGPLIRSLLIFAFQI